MKLSALVVILLSGTAGLSGAAKPIAEAKSAYQYSRHGNPDVNVTPTPLIVLSGGGTDFVEEFQQMCVANKGGDLLVLGTATFNKSYFSYIRNICIDTGVPANSVAVLIVPDATAADDPFVYDTIVQAESIWIAGGDQSAYINFWGGHKVQQALNDRIARGVAIGGTSAGMNVLSEFVFTAQSSTTVTSSFALANADSPAITIGRAFVKLDALAGIIADPHFVTRDRMGRDLAFEYRIYRDFAGTTARSICVDEGSAVLISGTPGNWTASVAGAGNAYFLQPSTTPYSSGGLLNASVNVSRVGPGGTFVISSHKWAGTYSVSAVNGVLQSTQAGNAIY
jgi:cyanophycinase-like exopeptidase